jgi:hypothetical protein
MIELTEGRGQLDGDRACSKTTEWDASFSMAGVRGPTASARSVSTTMRITCFTGLPASCSRAPREHCTSPETASTARARAILRRVFIIT